MKGDCTMNIKIKKIVIKKKTETQPKVNCLRSQCRTTHKRKDC